METMTGTIVRLASGRGFGFIRPDGSKGADYFFHSSGMGLSTRKTFDELVEGDRVSFEPVRDGDKGPRAREVVA